MIKAALECFLFDSDAMIALVSRKNPVATVNRFTNLAKAGRLRLPAAVVRELKEGSDKLSAWAERNEDLISIPESRAILAHHQGVITNYGEILTTSDGAADPLVVCTAIHLQGDASETTWVVVSDDVGVTVAMYRERVFTLGSRAFWQHIGG